MKDGRPLRFTYVNIGDNPVFKAVAGGIAAMLKNVGVQLDIRQAPSADFSTILTGKQFDMIYLGVAQTDPFGIAYICQVYCSTSGVIKSGVNDPKNDELIRSVNTLPTPDEQYAKAAAAETTGLSTFGILPTVNVPAILAVKTGLANYGAGRFFVADPGDDRLAEVAVGIGDPKCGGDGVGRCGVVGFRRRGSRGRTVRQVPDRASPLHPHDQLGARPLRWVEPLQAEGDPLVLRRAVELDRALVVVVDPRHGQALSVDARIRIGGGQESSAV